MKKRAVMIIANNGFRDEEFQIPKLIFEENGVEVTVASSKLSQAKGVLGAEVKPDMLISDIIVNDFDTIVFIGGGGSKEYWDNATAHKIITTAHSVNKIIGAICIAPVTLANAGVLSGRKATVFNAEIQRMKSKGVNCTSNPVERDGNIITANGPNAASKFAASIVEAMK
ncbi:DJ-1/PfpI family protein [Candidatus Omnitrophota bacterium]